MNVDANRVTLGRIRRRMLAAPATKVPFVGIAIFTFFVITSRWSTLFTEIGIYLALIGLLLRPQDLSFPPPIRWAVAFLLWASVSAVFAISPDIAADALVERLKALVIFFAVVNALRTPQQLRFYMLLILVAFLIYPARGTLQNYIHGETVFGRAIWNKIYANPNDLAAITLLMLGVAISVATAKTLDHRLRWALRLYIPVLLVIILLTQSRAAFIGLLVGFGPALLKRAGQRPLVALSAVLALAVLIPAATWHRYENMSKLTSTETLAEADPYGSTRQRFQILKVGWQIFESNPVLGVGIGCYNEANFRFAPHLGARDAHNTYLGLAAETGVPGLLLWLGLVASVLIFVRRRRRSLETNDSTIQVRWLERAIIGCLVAGFFGTYSGITIVYLILGTLWAAANVLGTEATGPAAARVTRRVLRAP
jgi:putative inorganic carbon (hco3(-)) transporter